MRISKIVSEVYKNDFTEWEMKMLDQGYDPEQISTNSATLGTILHDHVNKKDPPPINIIIRALENIKEFLKEWKFEILETEPHVYAFNKEGFYMYDGHIDIIGKSLIDNSMWIVDLKSHGLYDEHKPEKKFVPIDATKKAMVNLQTYLYKNTEMQVLPDKKQKMIDFSDYKRAVLHANQYGWEFIELKRNPSQKTLDKVQAILKYNTF